jgi:hypothetical protein
LSRKHHIAIQGRKRGKKERKLHGVIRGDGKPSEQKKG